MGGWRLARSLSVLSVEIHAFSLDTVIGTIGDAAHMAEASDHNPNAEGVVCAADIMAGHTNLRALCAQIVARRHPDCAYVIHDRTLYHRRNDFRPTAYTGSDPHINHIHVSVGTGTDGHRTQPYDDPDPWLSTVEDDVLHTDPLPEAATPDNPGRTWGQAVGDIWRGVHGVTQDIHAKVEELAAKVDALSSPQVDVQALAQALFENPAFAALLEGSAFKGAQRAEKE